jgi:uncharacterized cupin superfamily protein
MSGWFVRNLREVQWHEGACGAYTDLEEGDRFPEIGLGIGMLMPGQPPCYYHRESHQEGYLVLSGECLLVVEGEERPMRQWDYFHCPPGVAHIIVGAGDGPSVVLAVGSRTGSHEVEYPVEPAALKHGAGVERTTHSSKEAYAGLPPDVPVPFRDEFLPPT